MAGGARSSRTAKRFPSYRGIGPGGPRALQRSSRPYAHCLHSRLSSMANCCQIDWTSTALRMRSDAAKCSCMYSMSCTLTEKASDICRCWNGRNFLRNRYRQILCFSYRSTSTMEMPCSKPVHVRKWKAWSRSGRICRTNRASACTGASRSAAHGARITRSDTNCRAPLIGVAYLGDTHV